MTNFGETISKNRQSRLLAEIFEMLDVSEESNCDILKYQVNHIGKKINYVLHDDEKLVELYNWLYDQTASDKLLNEGLQE
ncbi:MAG: hypothetical protein JJU29_08900 [Verrucomicrobia bacterium]|nr:hypothetical protein [Verrucomicrobiota bacterium]MCH8511388.1 hypothetical protein [Kiritimatiellia bacterium]